MQLTQTLRAVLYTVNDGTHAITKSKEKHVATQSGNAQFSQKNPILLTSLLKHQCIQAPSSPCVSPTKPPHHPIPLFLRSTTYMQLPTLRTEFIWSSLQMTITLEDPGKWHRGGEHSWDSYQERMFASWEETKSQHFGL